MKAIVLHQYGGPEQLRYEETERPAYGNNEVLVRVRATSVNPIDFKLRSGAARARMPLEFPAILGRDLAGEVVETGRDVTGFPRGMRVMAVGKRHIRRVHGCQGRCSCSHSRRAGLRKGGRVAAGRHHGGAINRARRKTTTRANRARHRRSRQRCTGGDSRCAQARCSSACRCSRQRERQGRAIARRWRCCYRQRRGNWPSARPGRNRRHGWWGDNSAPPEIDSLRVACSVPYLEFRKECRTTASVWNR